MSGTWSGMSHRLWSAACAACAARPEEGHRTVFFIAAMVLLPFVVGGGAVAAIRALERHAGPAGATGAEEAAEAEHGR